MWVLSCGRRGGGRRPPRSGARRDRRSAPNAQGVRMMGGEIGLRGEKSCGRWQNWESRSGEKTRKWTNEPKQGQLGSMRNSLLKFRLGRRLIADRGLTRCSLKMQQRITDSSVVRGQLSVEPGYRPVSVVSCQLSVVSCQLSVVSCQLSVAGRRGSERRDGAVEETSGRARRRPFGCPRPAPNKELSRGGRAGRFRIGSRCVLIGRERCGLAALLAT